MQLRQILAHCNIRNTPMAKTTNRPLILLMSLFTIYIFPLGSSSPHNIKGMFIFGSSYLDNGSNKFLKNCYVQANFTPYGIDFPLGPSGRFTNGKNVVDLLGEELNLPPYIPVFTSPDTKGSKIVNGVSFASGGAGIVDDTNSILGVLNLKQQIKNFKEVTLVELETLVGCKSTELLPNYLFVLGIGGNDFTANYFRNRANFNVTLEKFSTDLTNSLSLHIKKLYDFGARKFVLMSSYPIGCSPQNKAIYHNEKVCVRIYNKGAVFFNNRLKLLVDKMMQQLSGSYLVFVNAYDVILDIIQDPISKGFCDTTACCDAAIPRGGGVCKIGGSICENRNTHVYFDGVHPTEAVNRLIAKSAFGSNLTTEVYPINVKQLASI